MKKIMPSLLKGKKVLLRLDLNSAVYKNKIIPNPRFIEHAKTLKFLSKSGAKITILAHQGRKGDKDYLKNLSQHAKLLQKLSKVKVKYVNGLFEKTSINEINKLKSGQAILLRNVRSYEDELNPNKKNNRFINFSKNFDLYINDAFSICHRNQSSITIPPKAIPSFAGPVLLKEINGADKFKSYENKKLIISLGGEKVSDYFPLFKKFAKKDTKFILGGVLANLFLQDKGVNFGYESLWMKENNYRKPFRKIKELISTKSKKLLLPQDFAVKETKRKEISIKDLPTNKKIKDIGKKTINDFKEVIKKADAILVKGPMGFSEIPGFEIGTVEILKEIAKRTKQKKLYSLIGGGHSTTTIEKFKIKGFSHISLSGGALIKYLCGEKLPGLEVLKN